MTKTQIGIMAGIALTGAGVVGVQHQAQAELEDAIVRVQREEESKIASLEAGIVDRGRESADFNALLQATAAEIESLQDEIETQQAELEEIATSHRSRTNTSRKEVGEPKVYGIVELDEYPVMIEPVKPVYPEEFKGTSLPGRVSLEFVVSADGEVVDARAIEATHPEFAAAAIEAVLKWKFDPGIVEGASVNARVRQVIQFNPGENASWF
jgi:TonB family protein